MKLRTYQADSMSAALAKLKAELGRDAVILHTRTFQRRRMLGLRRAMVYEITASDEPRIQPEPQPKAEPVDIAARLARGATYPRPVVPPAGSRNASRRARRAAQQRDLAITALTAAPPSVVAKPGPQAATAPDHAGLMAEVQTIRRMVGDVLSASRRGSLPEVPEALSEFYTQLVGGQVADELARRLIQEAAADLPAGQPLDLSRVHARLLERITAMLPESPPISTEPAGRPRIIALVGPTGVGKTTTIAKLAAQIKLRERRRVGLITIDTYRIAAVEQLKVYANILEVPLHVVLSPQDMKDAIARLSDCHVILVDTAGRSQRDTNRINDLKSYLDVANPDEVHLVVSSAASERTVMETVRNFAAVSPQKLLFTKLDESTGFGLILNVATGVGMQVSYLTNGQSVPNDLEPASARKLAEMILGPVHDSVRHSAVA